MSRENLPYISKCDYHNQLILHILPTLKMFDHIEDRYHPWMAIIVTTLTTTTNSF